MHWLERLDTNAKRLRLGDALRAVTPREIEFEFDEQLFAGANSATVPPQRIIAKTAVHPSRRGSSCTTLRCAPSLANTAFTALVLEHRGAGLLAWCDGLLLLTPHLCDVGAVSRSAATTQHGDLRAENVVVSDGVRGWTNARS